MKTQIIKAILAAIMLLTSTLLWSQEKNEDNKKRGENKPLKHYNTKQATSDRAQLHTISFNGLAFITGSFGADCFFPPGKVADFFGFQYMRDNDSSQLGHNTQFLSRIAYNVMSILSKEQMQQMIELAKQQEKLYDEFANKRLVLIKAFREQLESSNKQLNKEAVVKYTANLYAIDGELSYERAKMMAAIVQTLTKEQKEAFNQLSFSNSATWKVMNEPIDKKGMSHRAHVAVMTYASEFFSWYKGSLDADIYFCPERHGTYFGGFYLKDYPAMGNPQYFISTALTGDAGKDFLDNLTPEQRKWMDEIPTKQKKNLDEIVKLRTIISTNLRKLMNGETVNKTAILNLVKQYGEQDGEMSYLYTTAFFNIKKTLTPDQNEKFKKLRNLDVVPPGAYLFSDPIAMPTNINTQFLFN